MDYSPGDHIFSRSHQGELVVTSVDGSLLLCRKVLRTGAHGKKEFTVPMDEVEAKMLALPLAPQPADTARPGQRLTPAQRDWCLHSLRRLFRLEPQTLDALEATDSRPGKRRQAAA